MTNRDDEVESTRRPSGEDGAASSRGIKPAAVDIIRKKNIRELIDDSAALRIRAAALQTRHERLAADVAALEAELATLRKNTMLPKTS